jgi:hypothetical protein
MVLEIGDPPSAVVDLTFQPGRVPALTQRRFGYNALLHNRLGVPVHSVAVWLRSKAEATRTCFMPSLGKNCSSRHNPNCLDRSGPELFHFPSFPK